MTWFFIALIGPILWATVNHIDKYFLSDEFKSGNKSNIGALMIFSTLFSIFILPIFFFLDSNIFVLPINKIFILILVGILTALAYYLYMKALDEEEASIIIPITQMIPVFGFLISYILLGENLTTLQMGGVVLIMLGSFIITLDIDREDKIKIKTRILLIMLIYSFIVALYSTMFKFATVTENFYVASFWEQFGLFLVGIVMFTFFQKSRTGFSNLIKFNGKKIFFLNVTSETLTVIGNVTANFALMLAPVTLVLLMAVIQPVFVFIIGIILSIFFINISKEKITKKHLIQKIISIIIIVIGSVIINY